MREGLADGYAVAVPVDRAEFSFAGRVLEDIARLPLTFRDYAAVRIKLPHVPSVNDG